MLFVSLVLCESNDLLRSAHMVHCGELVLALLIITHISLSGDVSRHASHGHWERLHNHHWFHHHFTGAWLSIDVHSTSTSISVWHLWSYKLTCPLSRPHNSP